MYVELLIAEAIRVAGRSVDQFGAQDCRVEPVRAFPVCDVNDAMIELCRDGHSLPRISSLTERPQTEFVSFVIALRLAAAVLVGELIPQFVIS